MKSRRISQVVWLVVAYVLCGCGPNTGLLRFVRPDDDTLARAYFDSLRAGRIDYALAALGPQAASIPGARDSLVRLAANLPTGPLDSLHVIGANRFSSPTLERSNLTYEYHSAQGWGAVAIAITGDSSGRSVEGVRAIRLTESLEQSNAFSFRGKSVGHYLMFALVLGCLTIAVSVAVRAFRTSMKRRWAWTLLALVGTGTVSFNWTTGQVGFGLLGVLFLDAAFGQRAPAAPWILQAAFPIGALMTWRRIQQARNPAPSPVAIVPTASDTAADSAAAGQGDSVTSV
jgi:hypothetical protein